MLLDDYEINQLTIRPAPGCVGNKLTPPEKPGAVQSRLNRRV